MFKQNKKGFTLIELIVVMAIIGVFVLLAMPKFMGYTEKARLTEVKNNIKQLETASERYYIDNQDWPRLSDVGYTSEQIESFAQEIKDKTGVVITLETDGSYYEIDYNKLQRYVQKPKDNTHYIIQNPVGEVFYLDKLTEQGKTALALDNKNDEKENHKPVAIITMTPNKNINPLTNITWDYTNSTDVDGDLIVEAEWQLDDNPITSNPNGVVSSLGNHVMKLRVRDSKGLWSDYSNLTFVVAEIEYTGDLTTIANGTASASSSWMSTPASKGFDGKFQYYDGTDYRAWGTSANYGWLAFEFNTPQVIQKYIISVYGKSTSPKNWAFEAWDGTKWIVLDTRENENWDDASDNYYAYVKHAFTFTNSIAYSKYRLNVSTNGGSIVQDVNLAINELEMMSAQ